MIIDILYLKVRRKVRGVILSLLKILQNENIDTIEEALIAGAMKTLVDSYTGLGTKIPDKAYTFVAKEVVKCLNEINDRTQLLIIESDN